jgi:cytochrome P450 family 4
LRVLHGFTNSVIQERKAEISAAATDDKAQKEQDDVGIKKRVAFLDLLIKESQGGRVLSDEDIREEVDTFMFEGHDTTASNMTFTLFLLANHPEIQRRCQAELDQIFEGSDRDATSTDLGQMKYLESCLKESLR